MDLELVVLEGTAQLGLGPHPFEDRIAHREVESDPPIAALPLRLVHRRVGVAHQFVDPVGGFGDDDADARRREHLFVVDADRFAQKTKQSVGHDRRRGGVGR